MIYELLEGWTPGSAVKVSAKRTQGRRGLSFTYLRHGSNPLTGSSWIDVLDKDGRIVSFHVDEVALIPPKRRYRRKTV